MSKVLNKVWFNFSEREEFIQSLIIGLIAFLVPLLLGQLINLIFGSDSLITSNSQVIIGTIINSLLIVCAINLRGWKKIMGVITMPSVAAILGGYVFKSASVYMVYMIPFIWLGNFSLVYIFKLIMIHYKRNYFLTGLIGIVIKSLIIFAFFSLLSALNVFPSAVVTSLKYAMGAMQVLTGFFGIILGYLIYTSYRY